MNSTIVHRQLQCIWTNTRIIRDNDMNSHILFDHMQPNTDQKPEKVYECFSCGTRTKEPTTEGCPDCGNELMNLSCSRDL